MRNSGTAVQLGDGRGAVLPTAAPPLVCVVQGEQCNAPLVIGISGHRDAVNGDQGELKKAVRLVLGEIVGKCPHTPLIVISALAEGADRLVAEIACHEFGASLVAVLPMSEEAYARDFSLPDSLDEFHRLLNSAQRKVELPLAEGNTSAALVDQPGRDLQYDELAKYIVEHSNVLIALWDGFDSGKLGGTSQVVRMQLLRLTNVREPRRLLAPPKRGPVYHITTPRAANPQSVDGEPYHYRIHYPPPSGEMNQHATAEDDRVAGGPYEAMIGRIDKFNLDVQRLADLGASLESSRRKLISDDEFERIPESAQQFGNAYAAADCLSIHYGLKTRSTFRILFQLAFGSALLFELSSHILLPFMPGWMKATFLIYPLIWLIPYMIWRRAHQGDFQNKFQDYRALAEGLRVQFFLDLVGMPGSVDNQYLGNQRDELEWIRCALRTRVWMVREGRAGNDDPQRRIHLSILRKHWLEDQRTYFADKSPKAAAASHFYRVSASRAFQASLVVAGLFALALFIVGLMPRPHETQAGVSEETGLVWREACVVLIGALTVLAASLIAYGERMAFAEHARQYRAMALLFHNVIRTLEGIDKIPDATERDQRLTATIEELVTEALAENGDWLLMHRERPLELPIP
jgi:hypothetical protein